MVGHLRRAIARWYMWHCVWPLEHKQKGEKARKASVVCAHVCVRVRVCKHCFYLAQVHCT